MNFLLTNKLGSLTQGWTRNNGFRGKGQLKRRSHLSWLILSLEKPEDKKTLDAQAKKLLPRSSSQHCKDKKSQEKQAECGRIIFGA